MKKIFVLSLALFLCISICACRKSEPSESYAIGEEKYKNSLVYNLTKTGNFDNILSFVISHKYDDEPTFISDKNDLKFLNYYHYSGEQYPMDKLDELFVFPENTVLTIKAEGGYDKPHYLLSDGSIVVPQDKSDTDTTKVSYDIFKADKENMLTEEKLIALLKKYDG